MDGICDEIENIVMEWCDKCNNIDYCSELVNCWLMAREELAKLSRESSTKRSVVYADDTTRI